MRNSNDHAPAPTPRAPVSDEELEQWAKFRADDAGHLARELITYRRANPSDQSAIARIVSEGAETAPMNEGPAVITKYRCDGCSHLSTEYWSFMGENDDEDSGTRAKCMKLDRSITSYWCSTDPAPKWCPFLATPTPTEREDTALSPAKEGNSDA